MSHLALIKMLEVIGVVCSNLACRKWHQLSKAGGVNYSDCASAERRVVRQSLWRVPSGMLIESNLDWPSPDPPRTIIGRRCVATV